MGSKASRRQAGAQPIPIAPPPGGGGGGIGGIFPPGGGGGRDWNARERAWLDARGIGGIPRPAGGLATIQKNLPGGGELPEIEMPDFGGGGGGVNEAELKKQREDALRRQGEADRDQMYTNYMNSATSATDHINTEIDRERSNAALAGVDYNVTDEQKSERINNYFATIWGEGDDGRLRGLMDKWGNPKGFEGWTVTRGDGSKAKGTEGKEDVVGSTEGIKPGGSRTLTSPEDEETRLAGGRGTLVLGG